MKNPELKKYLVPMFEEEKEMYEDSFNTKLSGKTIRRSKIEWLDWYISTQYGLVSLCYEKLMPLDYTLDEVKRLNEATTYSYRIGKMDGKNIAIIGIPNPNGTIKRIRSKEDNYNTIHMYENMTEEEAKNKTFTVYPFTIYEETQSEVEKVVQEIKQSRIDRAVKANLEEREASKALQSQFYLEQDDIPIVTEEVLTEVPQGPVLQRTLDPNRY